MDSDPWSSFRYCFNINLIFFCWQYPGLENCISEHPKPFVSWRTVRHKVTYTITERKTTLKGKLTGYSHKWKHSNHEELVACKGLLTIIMGVINMSGPESMLEYQRLVLEAHQFLNQFLLKTGGCWCSTLSLTEQTTLEVYFKYTSFILWTLEVQ